MHSRGDDLSIVNKGKSKTTPNQPFSKVPDDVLFSIFEKLEWLDRLSGSEVCKQWFRQMTKIPNRGEFPWLFRHKDYDGLGCKVKLTDEYSKRSYRIDQPGKQLDIGARICASRFGGILMKRPQQKSINTPIDFFVYCPFNVHRKLMNLPTVNGTGHTTGKFTFSSNPTSPDCVFFAILTHPQRIDVSTCRIGDEEWKKFQIELSIPYVRFSFECVNGLLYVVLARNAPSGVESDPILDSHVGTFDVESKEWKLIKNEEGFTKRSDGKKVKGIWEQALFPVVYDNKELYIVRRMNGSDEWDLFKYDMEEKQWVEQSSLGNRVLFIACDGNSSLLVDAVGKLSNVANKAFFGFRGSLPYYCPFSFSSRKIERHLKFYVDDRDSEDGKFYEKAWIMPTISRF